MTSVTTVRRAAALVAAAAVCGACALGISDLSREKVDRVELGMTKAQVREILGEPASVSERRGVLYSEDEGPIVPGEIPPPNFTQETFIYVASRKAFAMIHFEDDRVFGVRYNNEYLKGDWMEGEGMPPVLYPGGTS